MAAQMTSRAPRPLIPGSIVGYVRDANTNAPLQGAVVELQSDFGNSIQQVMVGSGGRFEFNEIGRGLYYVVARAPGYKKRPGIRVDLSSTPNHTVILSLYPEAENRPASSDEALVNVRSLSIPENAQKQFDHARDALEKKKDLRQAAVHLQEATQLYPDYVEAHHLLATVYMDEGEWQAAEKSLQRALELDERFAPSYFAWGAMLNRHGKPAEAEKLLQQGLSFAPNSWQGHLELCKSYLALEKLESAETHAVRAHEVSPEQPVTHLVLADIYVAESSYLAAKTEYEHFLKRMPDGPWADRVKQQIARLDHAIAGGHR